MNESDTEGSRQKIEQMKKPCDGKAQLAVDAERRSAGPRTGWREGASVKVSDHMGSYKETGLYSKKTWKIL